MFSNDVCFNYNYMGNFNNKEDFEDQLSSSVTAGTIVTVGDDYGATYIYTGNDWDLLVTDTGHYEQEPIYRELLPQVCKCCGAPLHNHKCEYCGVEYA